jgi:hypothetical protein
LRHEELFFISVIIILIGFLIFNQNRKSDERSQRHVYKSTIPFGVPINDTEGKILGNPQNAIDDMKLLMRGTQMYCQEKGIMPGSSRQSARMVIKNYKQLGLSEEPSYDDLIHNPDAIRSDHAKASGIASLGSQVRIAPYAIIQKRPDGSPIDVCRSDNTRKTDVVMVTDIYVYKNQTNYHNETTKIKPVGYYVVAWNDGTVETIPHDKILYYAVPGMKNAYSYSFPGQTGLPKETKTYSQVHRFALENGKNKLSN